MNNTETILNQTQQSWAEKALNELIDGKLSHREDFFFFLLSSGAEPQQTLNQAEGYRKSWQLGYVPHVAEIDKVIVLNSKP